MSRSKKSNQNRRRQRSPDANDPVSVARQLENVTETLDAVRHALEDFITTTEFSATSASRQKTAIRNFVEQARSVTWTIERLKGELSEDEWTSWWEETTRELREDVAASYFYRLRNPIIKGGVLDTAYHLKVNHLAISPPPKPWPRGTKAWAIDMKGQPVWIMQDDTRIPITPGTPLGDVEHWIGIKGMPPELEGQHLPILMQRHLAVLERVVIATRARFGVSE